MEVCYEMIAATLKSDTKKLTVQGVVILTRYDQISKQLDFLVRQDNTIWMFKICGSQSFRHSQVASLFWVSFLIHKTRGKSNTFPDWRHYGYNGGREKISLTTGTTWRTHRTRLNDKSVITSFFQLPKVSCMIISENLHTNMLRFLQMSLIVKILVSQTK